MEPVVTAFSLLVRGLLFVDSSCVYGGILGFQIQVKNLVEIRFVLLGFFPIRRWTCFCRSSSFPFYRFLLFGVVIPSWPPLRCLDLRVLLLKIFPARADLRGELPYEVSVRFELLLALGPFLRAFLRVLLKNELSNLESFVSLLWICFQNADNAIRSEEHKS